VGVDKVSGKACMFAHFAHTYSDSIALSWLCIFLQQCAIWAKKFHGLLMKMKLSHHVFPGIHENCD